MEHPIVKLELEGMKQTVVVALTKYHTEISKVVSAQIDEQIKNFDLDEYIKKEVETNIKNLVDYQLKQMLGWEVNSQIAEGVKKILVEKLNPSKDL